MGIGRHLEYGAVEKGCGMVVGVAVAVTAAKAAHVFVLLAMLLVYTFSRNLYKVS